MYSNYNQIRAYVECDKFYHELMSDPVDLCIKTTYFIIELRLHDIETDVNLAAMLVLI